MDDKQQPETSDVSHLREQAESVRARADLLRAKTELHLAESMYSAGMIEPGLNDLFNPFGYRLDDFGGAWLPLGVSAGSLYSRQDGRQRPFAWADFDLDNIRSFARWLTTRNPQAIGIVDALADYTIKTGYSYDARPGKRYSKDPIAKRLASQVQQVIDEFLSLNVLGELADQQYTWADREREAVIRSVRDGEVFLRTFDVGDGVACVRFVEPEQVRQPPEMPNCAFGVETEPGDIERPVAYHVTYDGTTYDRVPISDIAHLKLNVDSTVKRGLSDFYAVGEALDGVRKLIRNMTVSGGVQAAIAWIEQYENATSDQVASAISGVKDLNRPFVRGAYSGRELNYRKWEAGTVPCIPKGKEYVGPPVPLGSSAHIQIVQAALRSVCARWGMPEYFTGDASNNNFASILVSGAPFVTRTQCRQAVYGRFFLRVLWSAVRVAATAGRFVIDNRTYQWQELSRLVDISPTPPEVAIANESEQASIDHQDMQAGVMSKQTRAARRGLDFEQEQANLQASPMQSPGGGGPPGAGGAQGSNGGQMGANPGAQQPPAPDVADAEDPLAALLGESKREGEKWQGQSGRWFVIKDGKSVPTTAPETEGSGAGAALGRVADKAVETGKQAAAGAQQLASGAKALASRMGDKAWNKLPAVAQKALAKSYAAGAKVMHVAEYGMHKSQQMAEEAARERGLSEEQVKRVAKIVSIVDTIMAWTVNVPAATIATGNPILGKAAGVMPTASMAYLAYSTVRNPLAVLRAAKKALTKKETTHEGMDSATFAYLLREEMDQQAVNLLADAMANISGDQAEWYTALLFTAFDETQDLAEAIRQANEALGHTPAYQEDVAEGAIDSDGNLLEDTGSRREGETWKGPSGRWFTLKNGHAVPAKAPQSANAGVKKSNNKQRDSESESEGEKRFAKPKAVRAEMHAATRTGTGKDARIVLASGKPAPDHITPSMVPPNWTDVQVSLDPNADVLVTARDKAGRLKTVYSDKFAMRNAAIKFSRVQELVSQFGAIAEQIQQARKDPSSREHADCAWLMSEQATRPGSDRDVKARVKAYGATTLLAEHVQEKEDGVYLDFIGKEGVHHHHRIRNPKLAAMLVDRKKTASERGGKLFNTDDGKVRDFVATLGSGGYLAKDLRTARANLLAAEAIKSEKPPATEKEYKAKVKAVAERVSSVLGNRPQQALESYINPEVFAAWRAGLKG